MSHILPKSVVAALWSYDLRRLDLERDRDLIIKNVLDYGTWDAVEWLKGVYNAADIRTAISKTSASAWGKKSRALWSAVYETEPGRTARFS